MKGQTQLFQKGKNFFLLKLLVELYYSRVILFSLMNADFAIIIVIIECGEKKTILYIKN